MILANFQSTQLGDQYSTHANSVSFLRLTIGTGSIRELHTFWTGHELHPSGPSIGSYTFRVFAIAIDPATNRSVNIAQFAIANPLGGFTISSRDTKTMERFAYDADSGPTTVEIESRALDVDIRRSKSAHILNVCIFTTNWVLTLVSAYIAGKAATNGRVDFAVVMVHGSMALAIPNIRKLYISPPPFGAFIGILAVPPPFRYLIDVLSRLGGIFLTDRHRGPLFHGVDMHNVKVILVDKSIVPQTRESREGVISETREARTGGVASIFPTSGGAAREGLSILSIMFHTLYL